jgi:heme/copper-type cytochrome/quinol oxidase subunit 2
MADRIGIYDGRNTMFNGDGFSAQVFNAEAVDVAAFQALSPRRATLEKRSTTAVLKPSRPQP